MELHGVRVRQGLIVFLPNGDAKDRTRPPAFYDETYHFVGHVTKAQMKGLAGAADWAYPENVKGLLLLAKRLAPLSSG
jgi:hypothetical protein